MQNTIGTKLMFPQQLLANHASLQNISPTGTWTPVARMTDGDTHHYTIEDADK